MRAASPSRRRPGPSQAAAPSDPRGQPAPDPELAARRLRGLRLPKAREAFEAERFEQLPNIGPAMARDLQALGLRHPRELATQDAFLLYRQLCELSGKRQDPCVLDTFLAAVDFMQGAPAAPWWHYTAARKQRYGDV